MNNEQLVTQAMALLPQLTPQSQTAVSLTTLLQRCDPNNSKLHAYLLASRLAPDEQDHSDILQLYRKMEPLFNDSELRGLCFDLDVDYEGLSGENRLERLRELITYMNRRQRLPDLVNRCQELRPKKNWDVDNLAPTETAVQPKLDIAVVIDIARPTLRNVAAYLDDRNLAANFVVFQHQQSGQFLTATDDWSQLAITFGAVMDRIKRDFNGAQIHFFMAGPVGLLFAMGCIWGTVDEAIIYHYENSTYHPVIFISRQLRQVLSGRA